MHASSWQYIYKSFSCVAGVYSDDMLQYFAALCAIGLSHCGVSRANIHMKDVLAIAELRSAASGLLSSF